MGGLLLVCIAAGLWGTVGVASALMSLDSARDPVVLALARTVLGASSLMLAAWILGRPRPSWKQVPVRLLAIFGLAGAAFQICLFAAFAEVGVMITVAVTVCAPVLFVAAIDAIRQRRPLERWTALAIALGTAGVLLAIPGQDPGTTSLAASLYGGVLLAGASLAFAALAMVTRTITRHLDPVRTAGLGLSVSAVALAALVGLGTGSADLASVVALSGSDLAILLYIGVAATGAAYLAFVLGMQLCSSASAGLAATMIEPGVAAILAALVLQERLTASAALGCALMVLAMTFLSMEERRKSVRLHRSPTEAAERA